MALAIADMPFTQYHENKWPKDQSFITARILFGYQDNLPVPHLV